MFSGKLSVYPDFCVKVAGSEYKKDVFTFPSDFPANVKGSCIPGYIKFWKGNLT